MRILQSLFLALFAGTISSAPVALSQTSSLHGV